MKKKRNGKSRKSLKRIPRAPDELFDAGPFVMARYGRTIVTQGKGEGPSREEFFRRAPVERRKLKDEIDRDINSLAVTLQEYDAISLATANLFKHGTFGDDDWSEVTSKGNESALDLVHSLLVAVPAVGTKQVTPELAQSFTDITAEVLEKLKMYYMLEFAERKLPDWQYELRFPLLLRFLFHRGASYEHHHRALIRSVFEEHDAWFQRKIGAALDEILAAVDEAENQLVSNVRSSVATHMRMRLLHEEFREYVFAREAEGVPFATIVAKWRALPDVKSKIQITADDEPRGILEVMPANQVIRSVFDRMSASPPDNRAFLNFAKSPGWPTNDSCIYTQPLVKLNDQHFNINPVLLVRKLDHILSSWIEADAEYKAAFSGARGRVVERLAVDHFRRILPGAAVFTNVFYTCEEKEGRKRREVDALILFDRTLFIIEAKSSGVSPSAWRGGFERLESNLREITIKAAEQLRAARDFIAASSIAEFTDSNGEIVVALRADQFSRTFLVNVTLESLGFLTSRPESTRALLGDEVDLSMWSVFVNDLRVISEVLECGSELIAFLESRLAAAANKKSLIFDELDYLMLYLYEGVDLFPVDLADTDAFMPNAYTYDLDRFYAAEQGKIDAVEKPRSKRPAELTDLGKQIERSGQVGFTDLCVTLLKMDRVSAAQIGKGVREMYGRFRDTRRQVAFSTTSKELEAGLTITIREVWSSHEMEAIRRHSLLEKYQHRASRWLIIYLTWKQDGPCFERFSDEHAEWREDSDLDAAVRRRSDERVREYVRDHGQPSRNQPCPCDSGAKYKKCHGTEA